MAYVRILSIAILALVVISVLPSCANTSVWPKPAEFNVYKIDINPSEVSPSENVTVTAIIGNTGGISDNYTAIMNVDGKERERQTVYIKQAENKTVAFHFAEQNIGKHQIVIGSGKADFTVNTAVPSKRYIVFFDRIADLESFYLDGSQYSDTTNKPDNSQDESTMIKRGPYDESPVLSPDGRKIAFNKYRTGFGSNPGNIDIWIRNVDGSGMRQVTSSQSDCLYSAICPVWFPDSQRIAFLNNELSGLWHICYTTIDTPEFREIVTLKQRYQFGYFPWNYKISQDGKRMIYSDVIDTDIKTMVIDINSKKITEWPNIDTSEISPVKSYDGIVTVITKPDGLYYADTIHKEPIKIPNTAAGDIALKVE